MEKTYPLAINNRSAPKPRSRLFYWVPSIDVIALFAFICGSSFLHGQGQLRLLGIIFVTSFFIAHYFTLNTTISKLFPAPPELLFYTTWVLWAGITGFVVAIDYRLFIENYQVLVQMFVMLWMTYAISRTHKTADPVYAALLVGGLIQIVSVLSGMTDLRSLMQERALGLTQNPNSLGFRMVWCVFAGLIFWHRSNRRWFIIKTVIGAIIVAAMYVLMASGSRKSAVAVAFLVFGWAGFAVAPLKGIGTYVKRFLMAMAVVCVLIQVAPFILENTPVGKRFADFFEQGQIDQAIEKNIRYRMYVDGLRIFLDHPIFGVGLDNFRMYFYTGQYSHSDYIEPLATTGLIGFILYQAFYFFLMLRCLRLIKVVDDLQVLYRLKMILLGLLTIMLLGFGTPQHTSQAVFLLLTAFSVDTWLIKEKWLKTNDRNSQINHSTFKGKFEP